MACRCGSSCACHAAGACVCGSAACACGLPKALVEKRKLDWMPEALYRKEQQGLKKAVAARKKADKAATVQGRRVVALPQQKLVPFDDPALQPIAPKPGPAQQLPKKVTMSPATKRRRFAQPLPVAPTPIPQATPVTAPPAAMPPIDGMTAARGTHAAVTLSRLAAAGGPPDVQKAAHKSAAGAHEFAAKLQAAAGNQPKAAQHAAKAAWHKSMASAPSPAPQAPAPAAMTPAPAQQHDEHHVTVSRAHPINPLRIRPPKGSAPAPGKSIGPIKAAFDKDERGHGSYPKGGSSPKVGDRVKVNMFTHTAVGPVTKVDGDRVHVNIGDKTVRVHASRVTPHAPGTKAHELTFGVPPVPRMTEAHCDCAYHRALRERRARALAGVHITAAGRAKGQALRRAAGAKNLAAGRAKHTASAKRGGSHKTHPTVTTAGAVRSATPPPPTTGAPPPPTSGAAPTPAPMPLPAPAAAPAPKVSTPTAPAPPAPLPSAGAPAPAPPPAAPSPSSTTGMSRAQMT